MGILNGFVDEEDPAEKQCEKYPFSEFRIVDWEATYHVDKTTKHGAVDA